MKSKMSSFNKKIFVNNFTRFWPLWAIYLVMWILVLPIGVANHYAYSSASAIYVKNIILELANIGGLLSAASFGFLGAAAVFAYSFSGRSSNFFASLPIKREGLFITNYLSGLFWFIAANAIVIALSAISLSHYGETVIYGLFSWFGIVTLQMIVFYSISVFCVSISGNIWGYGFSYAALNCVPIICEFIVKYLNSMFLRGITVNEYFVTRIVTPIYYLWSDIITTYDAANDRYTSASYGGWTQLIVYAVICVALAAIGLLIYRKRHMEHASDLIAEKKLRPIFKYCFTFFAALTLGLGLYTFLFFDFESNVVLLIACMLIGGFVGYFASEMLLNKSFRVFKKWVGFAVSAVCIIAFVLLLKADIFQITKYVPDNNSIKNVTIDYGYTAHTTFDDADDITTVTELHKDLIAASPDFVAEDSNFYYEFDSRPNVSAFYVTIEYNLKSGRTVSRNYYIAAINTPEANKVLDKFDKLLNSNDAIMNRLYANFPDDAKNISYAQLQTCDNDYNYHYYDVSPHTAQTIYEKAITLDVKEGKMGAIDVRNPWENDRLCYLNIEFEIEDEDGGTYFNTYEFPFNENATHTWTLVNQLISDGTIKSSDVG